MRFSSLSAVFLCLIPAGVAGQDIQTPARRLFLDDAPTAAARLAGIRDTNSVAISLWRSSTPSLNGAVSGLRIEPAQLRVEANSGYATDRNNGSLWGGRGVNTQISAGVGYYSSHFSIAVRPELNYQENHAFATRVGKKAGEPLSNPFYAGIDLPQRFGTDAYTTIAPGQSFVRADISGWGAGVATENMWWGPGLRESIVLSNTAAGFPHAFLETDRPKDVALGMLGISAFWGRLSESDYFDTIPSNDHRLMTGLGITFQPKGLENLTLGFTRLFTSSWDSLTIRHFIPFFQPVLKEGLATPDNPKGNNPDDQRLSAFAVYKIPEAGFELYGEFGREDHSQDLRDLVGEPEHSAAYLIGFQSLRALSASRSVRVQGEWVDLQNLRGSSPARSTPVYYNHAPQGHTYLGQMLGAGIGPGAESQFLAVDVLGSGHGIGGFIERVRRNELAAPAVLSRQGWPPLHDVELTAGMRGNRGFGAFIVNAQASYSYRLQRDFIDDESNLRVVVGMEWRP